MAGDRAFPVGPAARHEARARAAHPATDAAGAAGAAACRPGQLAAATLGLHIATVLR